MGKRDACNACCVTLIDFRSGPGIDAFENETRVEAMIDRCGARRD